MAQPSSDRLASADAVEASNFLILETGERTFNRNMLNSQDAIPIGPRRDIVDQSVSLGSVGYHKSGCIAHVYSSQAPSVYIGSYDNADGKQSTYVPFINNEALENGSHGIHNELSSVAFHGYEDSPQMVHKSCVPVTSQFFARDNGHLYSAGQFPTYDSFCFQQSINTSYSISPTPVSQEKLPVHIDLLGNSKRSSLRANYSPPLRSSGRGGNYFGNSGEIGLFHQGFEGSEVGGLLSDWSNLSDGNNYLLQLSSPPASLKPIGSLDFSQDIFDWLHNRKDHFMGLGQVQAPATQATLTTKGIQPLIMEVNASAQFCGVAEMVGPVDFNQNVDYWLQDKWSGQFPVKWHIIKDVPNSQFRHILLENNDNKPVTNSRDTQEVEMEQGIEMLNIFKNYETHSSILDDFYFYEQRQKAMQERKAGQQASHQVSPPVVVSDQQFPVSLSADSIKKLSKSFAETVSLTKNEKEHSAVGKVVSSTTASAAYGI